MSLPPQKCIYRCPTTYVLLTHVCACASLYMFGYDGDFVIVTNKPVLSFPGLRGSQEPYIDRYKTGCDKVKF